MTDTKHTPGPWWVEEDTTLVWGDCSVDDDGTPYHLGVPVAIARGNPPWGAGNRITEDVRDANARLIAAAPDLLDALEAMFDCYGEYEIDPFQALTIHQARTALAKARGNVEN